MRVAIMTVGTFPYPAYQPTRALPNMFSPLQRNLGLFLNRQMHLMIDAVGCLPLRSAINRWRRDQLDPRPPVCVSFGSMTARNLSKAGDLGVPAHYCGTLLHGSAFLGVAGCRVGRRPAAYLAQKPLRGAPAACNQAGCRRRRAGREDPERRRGCQGRRAHRRVDHQLPRSISPSGSGRGMTSDWPVVGQGSWSSTVHRAALTSRSSWPRAISPS
jgi:hypothetical protein